MINDATRIRVIRALIGISSKELAARLEVTQGVITGWEKGRSSPRQKSRSRLEQLCEEHNIMFLPNGYPVLADEFLPKEASIDRASDSGAVHQ